MTRRSAPGRAVVLERTRSTSPWTTAAIALLGTMSAEDVARRVGCSVRAAEAMRRAHRIPPFGAGKPGHPPLGDAKRSKALRTRVTPAFEERVKALAETAGMTVSDWILGVLVDATTPTDPPT